MPAHKLSISLEEPPVDFLGIYQATHSVRSKSEVIAEAVRLLRERELEEQYSAAFHGKRAVKLNSGTLWWETVWVQMRRGDIYIANLDPARASEAAKRRPVVIVNNDGTNRSVDRLGAGVVTVVPLTTNTNRVYDFQVLLAAADTGLNEDSKAQAEQVRSVASSRLGQTALGSLTISLMQQIDAALRLHLDH
ncbi:type II toxin-antitoxin system PemK/MazF family toxin [Deinococcus sp.]|uniref:type II toxin-antitoxin system PemK/MazF family toxin n=1 Tax=Deinococcus sp. TaxID=47478 RepID=UPI003C7A9DCF